MAPMRSTISCTIESSSDKVVLATTVIDDIGLEALPSTTLAEGSTDTTRAGNSSGCTYIIDNPLVGCDRSMARIDTSGTSTYVRSSVGDATITTSKDSLMDAPTFFPCSSPE